MQDTNQNTDHCPWQHHHIIIHTSTFQWVSTKNKVIPKPANKVQYRILQKPVLRNRHKSTASTQYNPCNSPPGESVSLGSLENNWNDENVGTDFGARSSVAEFHRYSTKSIRWEWIHAQIEWAWELQTREYDPQMYHSYERIRENLRRNTTRVNPHTSSLNSYSFIVRTAFGVLVDCKASQPRVIRRTGLGGWDGELSSIVVVQYPYTSHHNNID